MFFSVSYRLGFGSGSSPDGFPGPSVMFVWPRDNLRTPSRPRGVSVGMYVHHLCWVCMHRGVASPTEGAYPRSTKSLKIRILFVYACMGDVHHHRPPPYGRLGVLRLSLCHTNITDGPGKPSGELHDPKSEPIRNWKKPKKRENTKKTENTQYFMYFFRKKTYDLYTSKK